MQGGSWVRVVSSEAVSLGNLLACQLPDPSGEVLVWRGTDGTVSVTDPRCPHEWTHLEAQGVVDGCELVCLAHFWRFDPTGAGSTLASSGRRDPVAGLRTYPCEERDGAVWAQIER